MRTSIKELEEKVDTINYFTNNKYELKLWKTKGCGVDISINGKWQSKEGKNFTNKEAMELLRNKFDKEIRMAILNQN